MELIVGRVLALLGHINDDVQSNHYRHGPRLDKRRQSKILVELQNLVEPPTHELLS